MTKSSANGQTLYCYVVAPITPFGLGHLPQQPASEDAQRFETRDPFRTPGGFLPSSDFESGGLSDPQFERHHAFVAQMEESQHELPTGSPELDWLRHLVALAVAAWILAMWFFPEALVAIFAR